MNVLAMDTSTNVLSIAVMKEGEIVGKLTTNLKKNHSVRLMPAINQLMKETEMKTEALDRIAVAKGPGSYTGIRIGLTTAKTLAWALEIPIVGISSLEALAYQGRFFDGFICPFFDARRNRVYTGLYQWKEDKIQELVEDQNLPIEEVLEALKQKNERVLFLSTDIQVYQREIKAALGEKAVIPETPSHLTDASYLIHLALNKEPDLTHELTPNYIRLAEAESNWLKQQKDRKE
jgi:tRNA threonylcarbamoyladenosine biosynthesis protein TsaB